MGVYSITDNKGDILSGYRDRLIAHSVSDEEAGCVKKCRTRKAMFELLASPVGIDMLMESLKGGWGMSAEDFYCIFRHFVNGETTVMSDIGNRCMSSQVWCDSDEVSISEDVRWVILIGCSGTVEIPKWGVVKIFMDPSTTIDLVCGDSSIVYVENYGGTISHMIGNAKVNNI